MGIHSIQATTEKRSAVDDVFDRLHSDIISLRLAPGSKLSEVDIAKQYDVSRQPVREAFIRLNSLKLLEIRPQRATLVRKISQREILNARFIRTAVESEVVRRACVVDDGRHHPEIEENLHLQSLAVDEMNASDFHTLDYEFHYLICASAECEFAYQTIAQNKAHVDRLCMISLSSQEGLREIYDDHAGIYDHLKNKNEDGLVALLRLHLTRLDRTVASARQTCAEYFED